MTDTQIVEKLHEASLQILNECGIEFQSDAIVALLEAKGVAVKNGRAYFTPEQVMHYVNMAPRSFTIYARDPKYNVVMNANERHFTPGYGSSFITEADGKQRESLYDDFIRFAKLVHVADAFRINGGILAQPCDLEAAISSPAMAYATMKLSSKCLMTACGTKENAEDTMNLAAICFGGREVVAAKPCTLTLISTLSPLMVDKNALESLTVYAEMGQPVVIAPGCMAGSTGPITPAGNVAMANAEILGTIAVAQMINPGTPVIYGFAATTADMATMGVSNGSPGFTLEAKYGAKLAKKYNLPHRSGGGMTDAHHVTAQAGVESAMNLFESFSEGANLIMHSVGSLQSFGSMSYEKFALDIETISRLDYYFKTLDVSDEALALDVIKEVATGDLFITHEHTLNNCRTVPWPPQVSQRGPFKPAENPHDKLMQAMEKRVACMLDAYERPAMDVAVEKQLDDYMRKLGMSDDVIHQLNQ